MQQTEDVLTIALKAISSKAMKDMRLEAVKTPEEYTDWVRLMLRKGYAPEYHIFSNEYRKFMADTEWRNIYKPLLEGAREIVFKMQKRMSIQKISSITAQHMIEEVMRRHHWEYSMDTLLYKVKVQIVLGNHKKAVFYLKYSNMHKDLENMEDGMVQFEKVFQIFKRNVTINEIGIKDEWNKL